MLRVETLQSSTWALHSVQGRRYSSTHISDTRWLARGTGSTTTVQHRLQPVLSPRTDFFCPGLEQSEQSSGCSRLLTWCWCCPVWTAPITQLFFSPRSACLLWVGGYKLELLKCRWGFLGGAVVKPIQERQKWQPTVVFLPGKSPGQRSLVSYSPRGHKDLDTMKDWAQTCKCKWGYFFTLWVPLLFRKHSKILLPWDFKNTLRFYLKTL